MTVLKYSDLVGGTGTGTGTVTNVTGTSPISVATGTTTPAISITPATTSAAGSMSAADKTKLDGIAAGAQVNVATNLSLGTATGTGIPLNSSTGTGITLPIATASVAGLMSAADKTTLNGLVAGGGTGTVTNVTGTSPISVATGTTTPVISIAPATTSTAGSMSATDKAKLDGIAAGGGVPGVSGRYSVKVVFSGGNPSSVSESTFPTGWIITPSAGKVSFAPPTVQDAKAPVLVTFYAHITANNTNVLKFPLNSAPVSVSSIGVIDVSLYSYDVGADANGGYAYVNILF